MAEMPTSGFSDLGLYEQNASFRPSIRSRDYDDEYVSNSRLNKPNRDSRDLQELLDYIERRIRRGLEIDSRDATKLMNLGLLELPPEYELSGSKFVRKVKGAVRSKAMSDLDFTPTEKIGGGLMYGSGAGGALTEEDVRRELATSAANRRAQQESFLAGAIARTRGMGAQTFGTRPSVEDITAQLAEARTTQGKTKEEKAGVVRPSKAERNFQNWAEQNPAEAQRLALAQQNYELDLRQQRQKEQKEKETREIMVAVNEAMKDPDIPAEVKDQLRKLKAARLQPGADIDGILAEMKALSEAKTKQELDDEARRIAAEERSAIEWDRRRQETEAAQRRIITFREEIASASAAEKISAEFKRKIEAEIRNAQKTIEGNKAWEDDPVEAPKAKIANEALQNEIRFLESQLPKPGSAARYSETNPARPETQADFDALPSGSYYINPADGMVYIKN